MFDHLSGLCRDASWLKSYMASELVLLKELMQVGRKGLAMASSGRRHIFSSRGRCRGRSRGVRQGVGVLAGVGAGKGCASRVRGIEPGWGEELLQMEHRGLGDGDGARAGGSRR